jgi:hypothetical protein
MANGKSGLRASHLAVTKIVKNIEVPLITTHEKFSLNRWIYSQILISKQPALDPILKNN